jgi:flagellar FliL protein
MAEPTNENEDVAEGDDTEAAPAPEQKKKSKLPSKKLLIIVGAVVLLLILGGGGAAFTGMLGGSETENAAEPAEEEEEQVGTFYDLPEMLVNLSTNGKKLGFLKLRVALELKEPEATEHVEAVLPRIIDNFQTYLRGLRMEDLNGSAGLYRLREELLLRVSAAVKPVEVKDVLFKEMLVQ